MIIFSLFMLPLLSGCDDNKGGASAGGSTSGEDTTGNSMTDGSPTEGGTSVRLVMRLGANGAGPS